MDFMIYGITVLLFLRIECSIAGNSFNHNGLLVSDYCPKIQYCSEGTHVICMYYNPDSLMGPRCNNPKNISITPEVASTLLDMTNALRSKIATGMERGKNGQYLPRGYGLFKLRWDSELATFAQVLANQCVLKHDMCRATKKFPDPGQTAGMVRFSYPDWFPISQAVHFDSPGLSDAKISYAITQTIKSWYGQKSAVTPGMVMNYPDWTLTPNRQNGRLFLEMSSGETTHMGCGISAYSEHIHQEHKADGKYNSIQLICNFSARPHKGAMVYNIIPPEPGDGLTPRCGCPMNSKEDANCLCVSSQPAEHLLPQILNGNPQNGNLLSCPANTLDCEPTLVLLPILSMTRDPQDPFNQRGFFNKTKITKNSMEIFDPFARYDINRKRNLNFIEHHDTEGLLKTSNPWKPSVKYRYFDTRGSLDKIRLPRVPMKHGSKNKKSSIFTRAPQFRLPTLRSFKTLKMSVNEIKRDVPARKDFTNAQNLANSYMTRQRDFDSKIKANIIDNLIEHEHSYDQPSKKLIGSNPKHKLSRNTEIYLSNAEEKVLINNEMLRLKNVTTATPRYIEIRNLNEETDNKLMKLLDKLEQEVKHTELRDHEKAILDVKIREIYGKIVGKPVKVITHTQDEITKEMEPDFVGIELKDNFLKPTPSRSLPNVLDDPNDFSYKASRIQNFRDKIIKGNDNENRIIDDIYNRVAINKDSNNHNSYTRTDIRNNNPIPTYHERPNKDFQDDQFDKLLSNEVYIPKYYGRFNKEYETNNRNKYLDERNNFANRDLKFPKHRSNTNENMNYYITNDANVNDPLSIERRRYYQQQLENLEARLQNAQGIVKRRNEQEIDHRARRIRPPIDDMQMRPRRSKNQMDSLYLTERGRFLNAF